MPETKSYLSPLDPRTTVLQIQRLTAKPTITVAHRRGNVRIDFSRPRMARGGGNTLDIHVTARCISYRRRPAYGSMVFLDLRWRLRPLALSEGTGHRITVRPGLPFTGRDWALQVIWYVVMVAVIVGTAVAALTTGNVWLWELAGGLTLLFALLYALLARAYTRAIQALAYLLEQVFEAKDGYDSE